MDLFSPRIGFRQLGALCRRLATALEAGIDVRRVFAREAQSAGAAALNSRLLAISQAVAAGTSVTEAVARTGEYFPLLFRELTEVGEETGQLPEIFRHLADHYDHQVTVRRTFLVGIAWPMIQLAAAVCIVGFVIWVMGIIGSLTGSKPIDVLGFGLVGTSGLVIYVLFIGSLVGAALLTFQAARRGMLWAQPVELAVLRIPVLGEALKTLALARLAWTLNLTMETGMAVERAVSLSLRSTRTSYFTRHAPAVLASLRGGNEISEAFAATGAFPSDFLESLRVGEHSGRLSETMKLLSRQMQERAWAALRTLSLVASFGVWAMVAAVIVFLILRLAMFYVGTIYNAAQGKF